MKKIVFTFVLFAMLAMTALAQKARTVVVQTEPKAIVWVNDVRSGLTDESGKIVVRVGSGVSVVRVRANGFKETKQSLAPSATTIKIPLLRTTDPAELIFHKAEWEIDRDKAVSYYREAIKLRPGFAEAYLALAKTLNSQGDNEAALQAIANARKSRPMFSEASVVEGKIHKSDGDEDKAIASFKRAIREGKGFQPEAHKELGSIYKERAENFSNMGEFDKEESTYKLAAASFKTALTQYFGADPMLYEWLGQIYEKMQKYREALAIYEEYLRLFPNSKEAVTFRSYVVQVKKLMAGQ